MSDFPKGGYSVPPQKPVVKTQLEKLRDELNFYERRVINIVADKEKLLEGLPQEDYEKFKNYNANKKEATLKKLTVPDYRTYKRLEADHIEAEEEITKLQDKIKVEEQNAKKTKSKKKK